MANVFLEKGDIILVRLNPSDHDLPPAYAHADWDTVVKALHPPLPDQRKVRKASTPQVKASRKASLLSRAIVSGTWSTGALISRDRCTDNLVELLREVNYYNLSSAARASIDDMVQVVRDNHNFAPLQAKLQPVLNHFGAR